MTRLVLGLLGLGLLGCSSTPPARWAEGGAALTMARARWERPSDTTVDLLQDGRVLVDGDHLWTIDGAGRVVDTSNEPVALVEASGPVVGPDQRKMGGVGDNSAAPPNSSYAWLILAPDGQVTRYSSDGDSYQAGVWRGCGGPALRTCTLVSHLLTLREAGRRRSPGIVTFGVGVGVGIGR